MANISLAQYESAPDKLNQYLFKALVLHLIIAIIGVVTSFIFKMEFFKPFKSKKDIQIVQSSVRVDVVGLPKFTLQELKKMNIGAVQEPEEVEIEKPEVKTNETSEVEFKKKGKKVNLSNLLSSFSKKKIAKKAKVKKKKKIDARLLNKLVLEGNKVSKGSSLSGEQLDLSKQVFISYIQELPDKVKPNWKLPSYMIGKNLQCRVQIFIGSNGKVLKIKLYETSGDDEYDSRAMKAIMASSPLPKPPSSILSKVADGTVVLGFPL